MQCKLCGKDRKLVKAHIIPRCFFEIAKFQGKSPAIISSSENFSPLRRRIGIYDQNILCRECEDKFQKCDDYACKLLLHGRGNAPKLYDSDSSEVAYVYPEINYHLVKQFFLAVLLRADLSTDYFFQHVKLGPYRQKLIEYFSGSRPLREGDFSLYVFYYPEIKSGPLIVPPDRMLVSDIRFYHFHLGRLGFCIKVDRRPAPKYLGEILLRKGHPLVVIAQQLGGTQLHEIITGMLNNQRNEAYFSTRP